MRDLPYRYSLLLQVTVVGNGLHADGDGAMATAFRLTRLLESDNHVVDTGRFPSEILYLGRVDGG